MPSDEKSFVLSDCSKILALQGEDIYLALRQHIFTLISSCTLILFIGFFFWLMALGSFLILNSWLITSLMLMIIFLVILSLFAQILINWFYHIYIVTDRKLLEIKYFPMSAYVSNEVLLDQIKCTEVDMNTKGILYQLFNIGNITVSFDRPTHMQEFVMLNIKNYRQVGKLLTNKLVTKTESPAEKSKQLWTKKNDGTGKISFREEITSQN